MLSSEYINGRVIQGQLRLVPLNAKEKVDAFLIAEFLLATAHSNVGSTRQEWEDSLAEYPVSADRKKIFSALRQLLEQKMELAATEDIDSYALRKEVFLTCSEERKSAATEFSRDAILQKVATRLQVTTEFLEQGLYADLKGQQVVRFVPSMEPQELIELYEASQVAAALLCAEKVTVKVSCRDAMGYRRLFQRLKFLRLMFQIHPADHGYMIEVEGPYHLFEATTKYGLQLALLLPTLQQCDHFELEAALRWGRQKQQLKFLAKGGGSKESRSRDEKNPWDDFLEKFSALPGSSGWQAMHSPEILNLPGVGLCIPDLQFMHKRSGEVIYLELMGYWSRDAVWKRVELVEQGLAYKIIFAIHDKLRVSEEALSKKLPSALYVYKTSMQPSAVLEKLNLLSAREAQKTLF